MPVPRAGIDWPGLARDDLTTQHGAPNSVLSVWLGPLNEVMIRAQIRNRSTASLQSRNSLVYIRGGRGRERRVTVRENQRSIYASRPDETRAIQCGFYRRSSRRAGPVAGGERRFSAVKERSLDGSSSHVPIYTADYCVSTQMTNCYTWPWFSTGSQRPPRAIAPSPLTETPMDEAPLNWCPLPRAAPFVDSLAVNRV